MPYLEQQLKARLLIVDDESLIRSSMSRVVTEIGFSVRDRRKTD